MLLRPNSAPAFAALLALLAACNDNNFASSGSGAIACSCAGTRTSPLPLGSAAVRAASGGIVALAKTRDILRDRAVHQLHGLRQKPYRRPQRLLVPCRYVRAIEAPSLAVNADPLRCEKDAKGKLIKEEKGGYNDAGHAQNFLDCMRSRQKPNADLETVGHPSSLLCHLGNAAWRAGRTLRFDAQKYEFTGDADANKLLTRAEYRAPLRTANCQIRES